MHKKAIIVCLLLSSLITLSACGLVKKPLDERTGFTDNLNQLEDHIRNDEWEEARMSLDKSKVAWKNLKPLIQIDIDHDYVNEIEDNLVMLAGYIDTSDKPDSLAALLLIMDTWENIDSL